MAVRRILIDILSHFEKELPYLCKKQSPDHLL